MKTLFSMLKEQDAFASMETQRVKLNDLKAQLEASDYKVIQNAELIAAGLNPTYEPVALNKERQAIRDEIKKLEKEING